MVRSQLLLGEPVVGYAALSPEFEPGGTAYVYGAAGASRSERVEEFMVAGLVGKFGVELALVDRGPVVGGCGAVCEVHASSVSRCKVGVAPGDRNGIVAGVVM